MLNMQWNVLLRKKNLFTQAYRGRVNNCRQRRKVGTAVHFSFHIFRYMKEMIMPHNLLLFFLKKNCLDIISEYFCNFLSKGVNSYVTNVVFFNGKKIIGRNK